MSFGYQILGFGGGEAAQEFPSATGGTITTVDTDYKLHTFTADGQFIFTAGTDPTYGTKVEFLLVGGGAGGAGSHGGGGGGSVTDGASDHVETPQPQHTHLVHHFLQYC